MSIDKKFMEMQMAYEEKITELEAKLAEKEKKAKTYAHEIAFLDKKIKAFEFKERNIFGMIEQIHQDKINFAIEQLEKVKELMFSIWQKSCGEELLISGIELIDNQIEELKKEMK